MNPVRAWLFVAWLYGATVALGVFGLPALLTRRADAALARFWVHLVLWGLKVLGGVRVEVRGLQYRPAGPALIAAKHACIIDAIAPFRLLPDPVVVTKRQLLALPVFGWHSRRVGLIRVDREAHAKALRRLVVDAKDRLAKGRQVVIFPEGTRKRPGEPPDYKPGVAALYRELGLPCFPMATNAGEHCSSIGLPLRKGTIVFQFLEPIPPGLKRAEFMRELQTRIETATDALLAEGI